MNRRFLIPMASALGTAAGCGSSPFVGTWDATTLTYDGQTLEAPFVVDEGSYYGTDFQLVLDVTMKVNEDGGGFWIQKSTQIITNGEETTSQSYTGAEAFLWTETDAGIQFDGSMELACTLGEGELVCSDDEDLTITFAER